MREIMTSGRKDGKRKEEEGKGKKIDEMREKEMREEARGGKTRAKKKKQTAGQGKNEIKGQERVNREKRERK